MKAKSAIVLALVMVFAGCAAQEMTDGEYRGYVVANNNAVKNATVELRAINAEIERGTKSYADGAAAAQRVSERISEIQANFNKTKPPATWAVSKPYFAEAYGHAARAFSLTSKCYAAGDTFCAEAQQAMNAFQKALDAGVQNAPPKPTA